MAGGAEEEEEDEEALLQRALKMSETAAQENQ